jgi:hypothetical protein
VVNILVYFEIKKKIKNKNKLTQSKKTNTCVWQSSKYRSNKVSNSNLTNYSLKETGLENVSRSQKSHDLNFIEKETKAWICLCVVSGAQCILYSVFCVSWPIKAYRNELVGDFIIEISYWLAYIYSTLNPCLLLIFHEKFRTELKKNLKILEIKLKHSILFLITYNSHKPILKNYI